MLLLCDASGLSRSTITHTPTRSQKTTHIHAHARPQFLVLQQIKARRWCKTKQAITSVRPLLPPLIILTDSALCLFWVASACLRGTVWHRVKLSNS